VASVPAFLQSENGGRHSKRLETGEQKLKADDPIRRKRSRMFACAVSLCAIAIAADAVTVTPADARRRHGIHKRIGKHESAGRRSSYTPPYSAVVLDANSGKVLHADRADELRHPASLTKIMTLYLLFERLESGKIRLDSQLSVSEHASEQAPTKLGLKPGQTIEVEDAIRGLVTKSANDAAVTVAEAIGGSERDFADMMTEKARALGMARTVYRNASGLPNDDQITTARDQALLGRAIQERFPRYYRYFSTGSFTWHGETLRNHNHLLGRIEGMDGIKTGYTQASGFNLVGSVRRNDRHIVAVVLGGTSAGARDARMRSLIEDYIDNAAPQKTLIASAAKTEAARKEETRKKEDARKEEARREEARKEEARKEETHKQEAARLAEMARVATAAPAPETRTRPAEASPAAAAGGQPGTYTVASAEPIKPVQVKTLKVKMAPAQVAALAPLQGTLTPPATVPPEPVLDEAAKRERGRDLIAEAIRAAAQSEIPPAQPEAPPAPAAPPVVVVQTTPAVAHSGWMIQVGAFDVEQEARERLSIAQAKAGQMLKHASPFTETVMAGEKTFYRARFAGIQKDQAEAICRQLKRNDIACMTIKN
jgi:D-alanyl-D-alanine carboxypeptidase